MVCVWGGGFVTFYRQLYFFLVYILKIKGERGNALAYCIKKETIWVKISHLLQSFREKRKGLKLVLSDICKVHCEKFLELTLVPSLPLSHEPHHHESMRLDALFITKLKPREL